jgi:hypothetical protein
MRVLATLAAVFISVPSVFAAEDPRWGTEFGLDGLVSAPTGEFGQHVSVLGGISGHGSFGTARGALALRAEAGLQIYGSQTVRTPIPGFPSRINQEVTTDNWVARLDIGPELRVPSGRVRPFVNPFVGVSYFSTTSELTGPNYFTYATSTNYDNYTFSYGVGAGVLIPVVSGGGALSISARYVRSARTSYLTEGGIQDNGSGGITLSPQRSEGNMVEFRLGYSFGRGSR